jgi:hypothetical protein
MTLKEEREKTEYGVAGKVIGGHFHSRIVISRKSKKYNIDSLDPLYVDRFGNVFFRTPNKFTKAEITYHVETNSIEDLLIDLKNAGYVIIWFRTPSESTFTRDITFSSSFLVPA